MNPSPATEDRHSRRASAAVVWVLGLVAAGQAVTAAMAPHNAQKSEAAAIRPDPAPPVTPEAVPASPEAPGISAAAPAPGETDDSQEDPFATGSPVVSRQPAAIPPVRETLEQPADEEDIFMKERAPLDTPITDEAVLTELDAGMALRSRGDLHGALTHLRTALHLQPDHPKLIYQVASTFDLMRLSDKARPHWETLRNFGKGAGAYYMLASERLTDGPPEAGPRRDDMEGRLSFAEVKAEPVDDPGNGERVKLKMVIRRNQAEPVDPAEIADGTLGFGIHFFDEVNGRRIDRSNCADPLQSWRWLSEPVDWADGTEEAEVEYFQQPMSADELLRYGRRKYFGYALEIVYRGQMQDVKAYPQELADLAREIPPDRAPAVNGMGTAPDGSLFPALPANDLPPPAPGTEIPAPAVPADSQPR